MSLTYRFLQVILGFLAWCAAFVLGACGGRADRAAGAAAGDRYAGQAAAPTFYVATPLGPAQGTVTAAGLNAAGQVAGFDYASGRAFFYDGQRARDLGSLGGSSVATALNAGGWVVGYAAIGPRADAPFHAFLHDGCAMRDLGTFGGDFSYAAAINAAGQVAGDARLPGNEHGHAFLYTDGALRDLGTLGGPSSYATAINARGDVAGAATTSAGTTHAFLYRGGRMLDLGTLGGRDSYAQDVNADGMVAGYSLTADNDFLRAFLHDGVRMLDLGTLGGSSSLAGAVNAAGLVIGQSDLPGDRVSHAFLHDGARMRDLGTLGGPGSVARAINAAGQVVGSSLTASHEQRAFIWSPLEGRMADLGSRLLGAPGGMVLENAVAIADNGAIVAYANTGPVLLTPVAQDGAREPAPAAQSMRHAASGLAAYAATPYLRPAGRSSMTVSVAASTALREYSKGKVSPAAQLAARSR